MEVCKWKRHVLTPPPEHQAGEEEAACTRAHIIFVVEAHSMLVMNMEFLCGSDGDLARDEEAISTRLQAPPCVQSHQRSAGFCQLAI